MPTSVRNLDLESSNEDESESLEAQNCNYLRRFYTSETVHNGKAFEVNRRAVLAGGNIGIGHRGPSKSAGTMNMPPPMNENAYRDQVVAIHAEVICKA
ncbi:Hypothetical predicted protein [Paramuricea clavata]|uniref:Mutator-like transposase domain-containing protein n=1 Tax=Paramuricea clavata TaxID=317549 RepID=A0A7D9JZR1_PARCT|nr:Hypothetical predicted protein [Paramuricea clavata]